MLDREYFFKPYRERIQDMIQAHGSYQEHSFSPGRHEQSPSHNYHFKRPWNQSSPIQYSKYAQGFEQRERQREGTSPERRYKQEYSDRKKSYKLGRDIHEPVWEHLYAEGLRTQKEIEEAHKMKQNQIDMECTFQPMIRKNSRYRIPTTSNFLERNYIWQQNKLEKIVKQKQEQVTKNLQQCTFKPKLNKYYKVTSTEYHHLKPSKSMTKLRSTQREDRSKSAKNKEKANQNRENVRKNTLDNNYNKQEVGKIKSLIRNELRRIEL